MIIKIKTATRERIDRVMVDWLGCFQAIFWSVVIILSESRTSSQCLCVIKLVVIHSPVITRGSRLWCSFMYRTYYNLIQSESGRKNKKYIVVRLYYSLFTTSWWQYEHEYYLRASVLKKKKKIPPAFPGLNNWQQFQEANWNTEEKGKKKKFSKDSSQKVFQRYKSDFTLCHVTTITLFILFFKGNCMGVSAWHSKHSPINKNIALEKHSNL